MDRVALDVVTKVRLKGSLDSVADFHNTLVRELTTEDTVDVLVLKGLLTALVLEGQFALSVLEEFQGEPSLAVDEDEEFDPEQVREDLSNVYTPGFYGGGDK
jgi:hypothetical protein